jgi:hypothetical protein
MSADGVLGRTARNIVEEVFAAVKEKSYFIPQRVASRALSCPKRKTATPKNALMNALTSLIHGRLVL